MVSASPPRRAAGRAASLMTASPSGSPRRGSATPSATAAAVVSSPPRGHNNSAAAALRGVARSTPIQSHHRPAETPTAVAVENGVSGGGESDAAATRAVAAAGLSAEYAAQWDAVANKLTRPQHLPPSSVRLVHWTCRSCGAAFKRRVRDHVALSGACPACAVTAVDAAVATATRAMKEAKRAAAAAAGSPSHPAPAAARRNSRSPIRPLSASPVATAARRQLDAQPIFARDDRILSPMLAHSWDKYADRFEDDDELFLSPKLDGVRCIAAFDPLNKKPYFMSRKGNVFESTDWIASALEPLFASDPSLVLDGEIYDHDVSDFSQLIGCIKVRRALRTPEHEKQQQTLKFHVFDVLYSAGTSHETPFAARLVALERLMHRLPAPSEPYVELVKQRLVTKSVVDKALNTALRKGYEGVMLRQPDGLYGYGMRSHALLKAKRMQDAEYTVLRLIEGAGRHANAVGAVELTTGGKRPRTFRASFSVSDAERAHYWHNQSDIVGKLATIQFQELTPNGIPRFGQFKCVRSDASGKDFV